MDVVEGASSLDVGFGVLVAVDPLRGGGRRVTGTAAGGVWRDFGDGEQHGVVVVAVVVKAVAVEACLLESFVMAVTEGLDGLGVAVRAGEEEA